MFSWEYRKGPVTWIRLTACFSNKTVTAVRFCFFIYPLQKRLVVRLLSKHICLQPFSPKDPFFHSFLSSLSPWGVPRRQWLHSLYIVHKHDFFSVNFSWKYLHSVMFAYICFVCNGSNFCQNFRVLWGVLKKSWQERWIHIALMRVYRYLSQSKKNRWMEWKIFQGLLRSNLSNLFFKIHMKRFSFLTQLKIGFLLLFNGCRKKLGKMSGGMN